LSGLKPRPTQQRVFPQPVKLESSLQRESPGLPPGTGVSPFGGPIADRCCLGAKAFVRRRTAPRITSWEILSHLFGTRSFLLILPRIPPASLWSWSESMSLMRSCPAQRTGSPEYALANAGHPCYSIASDAGAENHRSLGYARDDKGEGRASLWRVWRWMDRAESIPRISSWVYSRPSLSGMFLLLRPAMVCPFGNSAFHAGRWAGRANLDRRGR
jgi:hypothetical protein